MEAESPFLTHQISTEKTHFSNHKISSDCQARAYAAACAAAGVEVRSIVEFNIGMDRAGVPPIVDAAAADESRGLALCRLIEELPGLKFVGIMGYVNQTDAGRLFVRDQPGTLHSPQVILTTKRTK